MVEGVVKVAGRRSFGRGCPPSGRTPRASSRGSRTLDNSLGFVGATVGALCRRTRCERGRDWGVVDQVVGVVGEWTEARPRASNVDAEPIRAQRAFIPLSCRAYKESKFIACV